MIEQKIMMASSLEARPAAMFVQTASKFTSNIKLRIDSKSVNAKSIMGVISLGLSDGQDITIVADGTDESEAVNELKTFLHNR